ncbi:N-acetylmuramoyl-L-alanine amidase [uncultured bacterium]|nr:N-acetylmuramoyl-L-alanine amidase [uncultured bacterium]
MAKILKIAFLAFFFALQAASASAVNVESLAGEPIRVVVIDPGHGGDDTGAKGPSGMAEKDVTLSIALKLAEVLKERMDARVLLTRTSDVFIPLEERTAFANANRADIFISIHVNAAANRDARGTETFFLSMDATDEDARRVAAFENNAYQAGEAVFTGGDDLKDILLDMASTRSHHESSTLAEAVHMSMLGKAGREGRGVKQARFTVLVGATMPAVLVEVGFISNPSEEKWLSSRKDQELAARAIADGVASFREIMTRRGGFIEVSGKLTQD